MTADIRAIVPGESAQVDHALDVIVGLLSRIPRDMRVLVLITAMDRARDTLPERPKPTVSVLADTSIPIGSSPPVLPPIRRSSHHGSYENARGNP